MTQPQMEEVTMQMLHTALEDIFLSVEEMPNARLCDHLEPYLNVKLLHEMLHKEGRIDAPDPVRSISRIVLTTPIGTDAIDRRLVEQTEYASPSLLLDMAFDPMYRKFVEELEESIVNSLRVLNRKFNPYAIVELTPLLLHTRILSLELSIGDDIRHVYFEQQFPSGRYCSNNNDKLRDEQSVCEDTE